MPISETVPAELIAGDTWRFTRSYADYPAPTWDLTFYAENKGKQFSQASTDSGSDHLFTVPAATSGGIPPGRYRWRIRATDGTVVETVEGGWLEVVVDPAAAGTHDPRSTYRRQLDAINAFLEGNASTAQAAMSIGGRTISRWPLNDLREHLVWLEQRVRTEEGGASAGRGRDIKVRFGSA